MNKRGHEMLTEKEVIEMVKYKMDLCKADLCYANLHGANLRGANLFGANLFGANLRGANLREANLCRTDLREADLRYTDLYGANLYGANLYGARLNGKSFLDKKRKENQALHSINISQIKNGWIALIGCEIYLFSTWEDMSEKIGLYIKNPKEAREKYK